jgi:hypothetical protein
MHLIQLLLPLRDNLGQPFREGLHAEVKTRLEKSFGGLTAYSHSPAEGIWNDSHDEILVYEVMVEVLDKAWWGGFRADLESAFRQDEVVIRVLPMERL